MDSSPPRSVSDMAVRVLVCGGRSYADVRVVNDVLDGYDITEMCQGGASGADALAKRYARTHGIPCFEIRADWEAACTSACTHALRERNGRRYCPVAGLRRNQKMLDQFRPDLVVAFPGGTGTAHMVRIARAAGVEVHEAI